MGYHFLIGQGGRIYAGRGLEYMGAHAGGGEKSDRRLHANFGAIGVALLGDFRKRAPAPAQGASLKALLAYLCSRYTILPDHVLGHREVEAWLERRGLPGPRQGTVCPGEQLFVLVEKWRQERLNGGGEHE